MKKKKNWVKIIFCIRIVLWVIALGATIYWIRWSFKIYEMGTHFVEEYAKAFRPIFARGLLITAIAIGISFILRYISDRIKDKEKYGNGGV